MANNRNTKNLLVIDWSNIMFRSLFMHKLFGGSASYDRIEDMRSFIHKFAVDVCAIVNMFKPNKVIIATDGKNAWRKDVYADYKSGREKDPNVNWDNIYKCSDDLRRLLKNVGMDIAEVDRAEADDIVALIKETVFEKYPDYNIIVVSADADIRQLIDFNKETSQYCVVYNTTGRGKNSSRRMYVTQEFKDWVESPDECDIFFESFDQAKNYMTELLRMNTIIELFVDDPNEVVLNKILCGDDGDNVPSFYGFYKNGKYVRVTPSKSKKILELSHSNNISSLCESLKSGKLPGIFEKVCKKTFDDINFNDRMKRQRTLVELNSSLFPKNIRDYKETIDYMLRNGHIGVFSGLKADELFKGTEYEGADKKKALTADVFKDLEKKINAAKKTKTVSSDSNLKVDALF